MPSAVPMTCLPVARKPNSAPDAHSTRLFGPGVTELTNENPTSARRVSIAPDAGRAQAGRLVRSCGGRDPGRPCAPNLDEGVEARGGGDPRGLPCAGLPTTRTRCTPM